MKSVDNVNILAIGDIHGHFLLALAAAALVQQEEGFEWDAILIAGDLGAFFNERELDSTTRRHAKKNPCELEFMNLWLQSPPSPFVEAVFESTESGGLGIKCPIITVTGNHEGFATIRKLLPDNIQSDIVPPDKLPSLDPGKKISILPSGWSVRLPGEIVVTGFGGIMKNERYATYEPEAFIDEDAVLKFIDTPIEPDILLCHEGPASESTSIGSPLLAWVVEEKAPTYYVHGHAVEKGAPWNLVCCPKTAIIGLHDIAFQKGQSKPGDGFCHIVKDTTTGSMKVSTGTPEYVTRNLDRSKWKATPEGILVPPAMTNTAFRNNIILSKQQ